MLLRGSIITFTVLSFIAPFNLSQSNVSERDHKSVGAAEETSTGVRVRTVGKDFEADKAGLRVGDTLTSWRCGTNQGKINSPFDVKQVEIEQAPAWTCNS